MRLTDWLERREESAAGLDGPEKSPESSAIVALVLVGRVLLNPLFRLVGRLGERELFVVAGLFTVVGASAVMHALHLSVALGAFVAGGILAE
jgi:Kef-type K+ transport system membrane component KefB